ncbi:MAG: cyclic nucleotide-binding domain-containing protein [Chloroflexi bacterium]|nr:cyclic nucleotide-binding domain-containing protein [Chloroflexota bacterium]
MILQGDVVVTAMDDANRERHIASLARGEFFGEMALLFDTPRTANVRTAAPSTFLVLSRDNFYRLLNQAPSLKQKIESGARSRMSQPFPVQSPAAALSAGSSS